MEQLVAEKQGLEERLSSQESELARLQERCNQLQGHLEREQAAGHQVWYLHISLVGLKSIEIAQRQLLVWLALKRGCETCPYI